MHGPLCCVFAQGVLTLRALAKGIIKEDEDMGSKKAGNLEQGEVFRVLEQGEGGRVRMWRGWVSVTNKKGKPLCVLEAAVQHMLHDVPLLQKLTEEERNGIAEHLEAEEFQDGVSIIYAGQPGECMYFIEEGEASAEVGGEVVMRYTRGDFFGEIALMTDEPRKATVVARGERGARCLKLSRALFEKYVSKNDAVLQMRQQEYAKRGLDSDGTPRDDASESDDESIASYVSTSDSGEDELEKLARELEMDADQMARREARREAAEKQRQEATRRTEEFKAAQAKQKAATAMRNQKRKEEAEQRAAERKAMQEEREEERRLQRTKREEATAKRSAALATRSGSPRASPQPQPEPEPQPERPKHTWQTHTADGVSARAAACTRLSLASDTDHCTLPLLG